MTPYVRIGLRVLAGWLIARGMPSEVGDVLNDPAVIADVSTLAGALLLAVTEGWYALAKRMGWKT